MNVLFEEGSDLRLGRVITTNPSTLLISLLSGKQVKIKSDKVILKLADTVNAAWLEAVQDQADHIDLEFLWEVAPDQEFSFEALAKEYSGEAASLFDQAAIYIALRQAPIYFHRKAVGLFRKSPPDILAAAKLGLEKKKQKEEEIQSYVHQLQQKNLPQSMRPHIPDFLYGKPNKADPHLMALQLLSKQTGSSIEKVLSDCGGIESVYHFHLGRFLYEHPHWSENAGMKGSLLDLPKLPKARVSAFSLDDSATTEIDDAFSVIKTETGYQLGVHISAPALRLSPESSIDELARQRCSTAYFPGQKFMMLPESVIDCSTLKEGNPVPVVSLYALVGHDFVVQSTHSQVEEILIHRNWRHESFEVLNTNALTEDEIKQKLEHIGQEWVILWQIAQKLLEARNVPEIKRQEFVFDVDWTKPSGWAPGEVSICSRFRGSPLDMVVSELMIFANQTWATMLKEAGQPALYRTKKSGGKTRTSVQAEEHIGLGVECYAWLTSPLRRYVDLCNQWQLISVLLQQKQNCFNEARLEDIAIQFEATYQQYAESQKKMEKWWCLVWLYQTNTDIIRAEVMKNKRVRLQTLPLSIKVSTLSEHIALGEIISLKVKYIDLWDLTLSLQMVKSLVSD